MKKMLIAAAAFMLASCASVENKPLENTKWKLFELAGEPNSAFSEGDSFTFSLDGKSITGKGSVNRFFGGYELDGKTLEIGEMGMTRMMGPNVDLEDAYVRMFDVVDGYEIAGDELTLTSNGKPVALFKEYIAEEGAESEPQVFGTPIITVEEAEALREQSSEEE